MLRSSLYNLFFVIQHVDREFLISKDKVNCGLWECFLGFIGPAEHIRAASLTSQSEVACIQAAQTVCIRTGGL